MAERNKRLESVILSISESGENNSLVTFLSRTEGILTAVLYGGPKSRLRSFVQPFNSGILYVYSDESKKISKITDFDVKFSSVTYGTSLFKSWSAALAVEIVSRTRGAGDSDRAFVLLTAFLQGIDLCSENEGRLGLYRFLWRYLDVMGLQPDVRECFSCGSVLVCGRNPVFYDDVSGAFYCTDCWSYKNDGNKSNSCLLDTDALTYLAAVNELPPSQVRKILLSSESVSRLRNFLFRLIESACESRLFSLESGAGIL